MKQKKLKKLASVLLAAGMMLACLNGCGKDRQTAGEENADGQQTGSAASGQENTGGKGRFLRVRLPCPRE